MPGCFDSMLAPIKCFQGSMILTASIGAMAQVPGEPAGKPAGEALPKVTVEGRGTQRRSELNGPTTVLQGDELRGKAASTLGATLQDELGVANSSFGPNVGLPILRGQGGSRVRAMVDGSGAHDASTISADHGVMVEPGLAERITVHRGPSAIRFGGDAIAGAVEIDYGRIPERMPQALRGRGELRVGDGSEVALVRAEGGAGAAGVAWHVDAHQRRKQSTRIPGWAIDEEAVKQQFFLVSGKNTSGYIANTDARTDGGAVGASAIFDGGFLGASVATLRLDYGVPPGAHSHSHGGQPVPGEPAQENVRIGARQQRLDVHGEFRLPWGVADRLTVRFADTSYRHDELTNGISGTQFRNDVQEARAEVAHSFGARHRGNAGIHLQHRQFSAAGIEAFVPRTKMDSAGLFAVEKLEFENWTAEAGLRADGRVSTPQPQSTNFGLVVELPERRFHFGNFSLAVTRKLESGTVTLTHWLASRAPDVQELYALGAHVATRTYDFGNSALDVEILRGWNLAADQHWGAWSLRASLFRYDVKDHIYQRSLGVFYAADKQQFRALCAQLDQCLPVTRYEQAQARFLGYEAELSREMLDASAGSLVWALFADRVRGRLVDLGRDVPRQPAPRWGMRLESVQGAWTGDVRVVRTLAQDRPGENETSTRASVQLHAGLRWNGGRMAAGLQPSFYVVGRNLTNREVRNSTSFLRNYAPEPGRTIEGGVEVKF